MSAILALSKALKIQLFKTSNEWEPLEQILANNSDNEIFKMSHELNGKALKKHNIEEEKRKNIKKKVQKSLDIYHLGKITTITSLIELIKRLVKRDYPHLDIFDGSQILQIFVPEIWLNKCPEIIGEKEYQELREGLKVSMARQNQIYHYDKYQNGKERKYYITLIQSKKISLVKRCKLTKGKQNKS